MGDPAIRDTTSIEAYLDPLRKHLADRAAGGRVLDIAKGLLMVVSLGVTLPLAVITLFAMDNSLVPPLRWPWRTLENLKHDVDAAKTSVAHARLARSGGPTEVFEDLYRLLEALDPEHRPLHGTLEKLAIDLEKLQRRLRSRQ
jgi:hypothetical protein